MFYFIKFGLIKLLKKNLIAINFIPKNTRKSFPKNFFIGLQTIIFNHRGCALPNGINQLFTIISIFFKRLG